MAIAERPPHTLAAPLLAAPVEERRLNPAKWIAGFGALILAVQAWTYARWLTSGHIGPSPKGPTPIPHSQQVWADIWQVVGVTGSVLAVIFFIVRPWRRTGHMTTDGMFVVIFFQLWSFQDAFCNYTVNQFQYSAAFVNIGSWYSYVPGWMSPNGSKLAEPILFIGGLYVWLFACGLILINAAMRRARARHPALGKLGLFLVAFAIAAFLDFAFEMLWLRQGLYSYGAHIDAVTIFPSRQYAMPMYEPFLWGICWGIYAMVRFHKNDRGEMVVERGISQLRMGTKGRQLVRFLVLLGMVNGVMLFLYNVPYQLMGLEGNSIPPSVTSKSYLTSGVCGIGTDRACTPNDRVPITVKPTQAYLTPEGRLVRP